MEPENLKAINQSFEIQADQFESETLQFTKQEYLDYTVESVKPCGEETMLEVAAGTCVCGRSFAPYARTVVCLDATDAMLEVGRREAEISGLKNMVFVRGYAEELQQQYCADPNSGVCACYNVGDEFMFYRDDGQDDYWHMVAGTEAIVNASFNII